jgi:chromosome partitioning protein
VSTGLGWPADVARETFLAAPGAAGAGWEREPVVAMTSAAGHAAEPAQARGLGWPGSVSRETGVELPIATQAAEAISRSQQLAEPLPRPDHCRTIAVTNQKGGVGKTTTTVNIAAALAMRGARVLVLDVDPQGNASTGFGIDHRRERPSTYDALLGERPLAEVVDGCDGIPGLDCAPATIDLSGAEIELVSLVARENRLRRALAPVADRYDYVFIDCPPSLGLLTLNALVAAAEVLIPIQCEYYALEGLGQLMRTVEMVQSQLNPQLRVSTILMTMYDARTRLAEQVVAEVRGFFGDLVLRTTVPRSVRISEAPGFGQPVIIFDPGSRGALSYHDAAAELAARGAADRARDGG